MFNQQNTEEISAIKSHITSWSTLTFEEIQFERLGGLSNQMWKVTCLRPGIVPEALIFRKFGCIGNFVDRKKENCILKGLAEQGVGPKFYGGTESYRIEKFYDSEMLTTDKLNDPIVRRQMAREIAKLHSVKLDELEKFPLFSKILEEKVLIKKAEAKAQKDIYSPIEREMLENILSLTTEDEITFLKGILPENAESVVFSHNDLHSQNVLVLKKTKDLLLIDYEYSDYNFRGYDIANLFNESMFEYHTPERPHYTVNESKFPDDDEMRQFIKYYLLFSKFKLKGSQANAILHDDNRLNSYIEKNYNVDVFMQEVEEMLREVRVCLLLSHYYWILWAIIMSKDNDIRFDYIDFAYRRFEIYQNLKRKFYKRKVSKQKSLTQ